MLARSKVALFHGALVSETLGPFQEQFHAFATAKATYRTFISCQFNSPLLQVTTGLQAGNPSSRSVYVSRFTIGNALQSACETESVQPSQSAIRNAPQGE